MRIPAHLLAETTYSVNVTVQTRMGKDSKVVLPNALTFMAYGDEQAEPFKSGIRSGVIAPRLEWHVQSHLNARKQRKSLV